jgi:hypothetical protein
MPPRFSGYCLSYSRFGRDVIHWLTSRYSLTTTSDLSFISSEPSVITSRSGKRFFVHSDIIGDLHLCTVGQSSGDIDLSAWSDDTVSRWIQFLYAGNYQIPEPAWQEDDKEEEEDEEEEGDEQAPTDRDGSNTPDTVQSQANREATHENILLLYVDMYVLAHSVGPDELGRMAFDRLDSALHSAGSFIEKGASKPAIDFIETLAYTFNLAETTCSDFRIRLGARGLALFKDFAVTHFGNLMVREEMSSLMRKNGDFAVQLMELVANKVREIESDSRNWKDKAFAIGEALQESIRNHEKIDDHLYRQDPWMELRALRVKLRKLYANHPRLRQEFKVYNSKGMEEFVSFDTKIVECLDFYLEAASKLFKSDWSEIENSEELGTQYEGCVAGKISYVEASARTNLTVLYSTETEGRPVTPLRPLELEVVKSAHMLRWLETSGATALVRIRATTRSALIECLIVRAAWLGSHAGWTRDKIEWYEARLRGV